MRGSSPGDAARGGRYAWLRPAIERQATVVTANRRLARELRGEFDRQQQAAGRSAWPTPAIFYLKDWLSRLLEDSEDTGTPILVGPHVGTLMWEERLSRLTDQPVLVQAGFVRQAQLAWQRLQEWRVPANELVRDAWRPEERMFARAATEMAQDLRARGWLDSSQLVAWASDNAAYAGRLKAVVHAGFDRISPDVRGLFAAIEAAGIPCTAAPAPNAVTSLRVHAHADAEAEFRAAGAWARRVLAAEPDAAVAIVATDLESRAQELAGLLREGFAPGWQYGPQDYRRSVNLSYGRRLAEFPAVSIALTWLRWFAADLGSADVSLLLLSPLIGGADRRVRSGLELALRGIPDRAWSPQSFADWAGSQDREGRAAAWHRSVRDLAERRRSLDGRRSPADWSAAVDRLLAAAGWPGPEALSSEEFQLVNRWRELLNEFAGLGRLVPAMGAAEAMGRLARLASEILYQPDTGPGRISLLGVLEAAGLEFDHLWIAGMDAGRWPPPAHPLALVPTRLQRRHGMPDASPADSLAYARRVLCRLAGSAPQRQVSWSRASDDAPQSGSPLLEELAAAEEAAPTDPGWHAASLSGRAGPLRLVEDPVPPARPDATLAGGARTVQLQLSDPFSAFACGRLGVREIAAFQPGISPSLRGTITHAALDALYAERPGQAELDAWSPDEVMQRSKSATDSAFRRHFVHADPVLRRLLALEETRTRRVLETFLGFERTRQPFDVVAVEQRIEIEHAGVRLPLRADRLDRLADGRLLVIDYKTGAVKALLDAADDPAELQVVVYAVALDQPIGGVCLFFVGSRSVDVRAAGPAEWDKVPVDRWPERLRRWTALTLSAIEAIAGGDVRVNLRASDDSRRWLNVLSRIEELRRES